MVFLLSVSQFSVQSVSRSFVLLSSQSVGRSANQKEVDCILEREARKRGKRERGLNREGGKEGRVFLIHIRLSNSKQGGRKEARTQANLIILSTFKSEKEIKGIKKGKRTDSIRNKQARKQTKKQANNRYTSCLRTNERTNQKITSQTKLP